MSTAETFGRSAVAEPGAALTRWRVSPQPGTGPPLPGLFAEQHIAGDLLVG